MIRKLIFIIASLFIFMPFIHAQEDLVDMKLSIYRWGFSNSMKIPDLETGRVSQITSGAANAELWYKSDDQWKSLNITAGERSKVIQYKGPRLMIFHTRSMDAEGKPIYRENSRLLLPANASESFVLMFKTGSTAKFYPMNVSPQRLPKEKLAIMNMTIHPAGVVAGGDAKILKPGAFTIFTPKKREKDGMEVKLAKFDKNLNKWRQVYDNAITIPDNKRCLMLLYDPYNSKTPKFTIQVLTL